MSIHQCPACGAPIQIGQPACLHCRQALDPVSLQRFYAWRTRQQAPPPPTVVYAPPQVVVMAAPKSPGLAVLLTILFGPLGMLYTTVGGALVMLVVSVIGAVLTGGLGLIITWPICVLWGLWAAYD